MKLNLIVLIIVAVAALGCKKGTQPVANAKACPNCDDLNARLAELEEENGQLRAVAERRQAIFDDLKKKLSELIDSGRLRLVFRRGMIVMQLPNQVLYESGKAKLKAEGKDTVKTVGDAIASIEDRRFLVSGHTDNHPIKASEWKSNWHLSSARAQSVLKVLLDAEVPPQQLAAAGFGEYDPDDDNDTEEGRALNRRTEIIVIPNLEQIFNALK